jgi:CubicO group peptidase (beta-lactamase class C family)
VKEALFMKSRNYTQCAGHIVFALLLATTLLALAKTLSAKDLPTVKPEEVGLSSDRLARLDAVMQEVVDQKKVAGIVALVIRHGKVAHFNTYGMADIEAGRPMRKDDMFRLYSMTKPVVSAALLMLYEEGKFQLTDPLEKYIPSFKNTKVFVDVDQNGEMILEDPKRKPTIQDALRHTCGLAAGLGPGPVNERYRELGLTIDKLESLRQEVEALGTVPFLYQPGERWVYGLGHDVQAYLVEYFSGMPLDQFLKQKMFNPLGMKETVYGIPADLAPRFAVSYRPGKNGELKIGETATTGVYTRFTTRPFGTFGLSSTAMDYARYALMLLNGGELHGVRVLGKKTVELMRQNHLPEGMLAYGTGYGLGVSVTLNPATEGNLNSVGSFGWSGAATTKYYIDPAEDMVAVICSQHMPYNIDLLNQFQTLVYQSIVD